MENLRIAVAIFFVSSLGVILCQEETTCRGKEIKLSVKEKAQVMDCLSEQKINSIWKIPLEKVACFGVCILKKKEMLTPEGKINHEKAFKYIDDHMEDKETKKLLIDAADKCIKEFGAQVTDNDPLCNTFMSTGLCVHDAFLEICMGT